MPISMLKSNVDDMAPLIARLANNIITEARSSYSAAEEAWTGPIWHGKLQDDHQPQHDVQDPREASTASTAASCDVHRQLQWVSVWTFDWNRAAQDRQWRRHIDLRLFIKTNLFRCMFAVYLWVSWFEMLSENKMHSECGSDPGIETFVRYESDVRCCWDVGAAARRRVCQPARRGRTQLGAVSQRHDLAPRQVAHTIIQPCHSIKPCVTLS